MGAGVSTFVIDETITWVKDSDGRDQFRVAYTGCESFVRFQVDEVSGWDGDTWEPADFERYLSGSVKWDSCSHFNFGDTDGYLHLCGVRDFRNHVALMEFLYRLAFEAMGREPEDGEKWEAQ